MNVRDQVATRDGVIYKGEKVVVPKSLHSDYLSRIHLGHNGIESIKKRARDILYWPGINEDIKRFVRTCSVCNSCKPHQQHEPLKIHNVPMYFIGMKRIMLLSRTHFLDGLRLLN